jgi:hypothetical protein
MPMCALWQNENAVQQPTSHDTRFVGIIIGGRCAAAMPSRQALNLSRNIRASHKWCSCTAHCPFRATKFRHCLCLRSNCGKMINTEGVPVDLYIPRKWYESLLNMISEAAFWNCSFVVVV